MFLLTRYFLDNLFGRQLLDEEGIVALRRVLITSGTGIASVGIFLPRLFHKKFADLDALPVPEPYRQALLSDGLLLISLVIMLAAFVAALAAPSMFPDEVDYVSLTPLPLPRRRIFGAKLLALVLFAGSFILAGLLLFAVSFPAFTDGVWAEHGRVARTLSFAAATGIGSAFAFLAVMAVQGLVLVLLPRRWANRASMLVQSAALAGLVISVPFVYQIATRTSWIWSRPAELTYFPPAWFLGLEQVIVGNSDPYFASLAWTGAWWLAGSAAIALVTYGWLYRAAERLISPPASAAALRALAAGKTSHRAPADAARSGVKHSGAGAGVWIFTTTTLARNRLPQLVFLLAWAVGLAIAANGLYGGIRPTLGGDHFVPVQVGPVVAMPLVLTLMSVAGLRAAMLLPVRLSANWVFRMTDWPSARAARLDAVEHAFLLLALLPSLALSAPVLVAVIGVWRGLGALLLVTLASAVLLELILIGWRRVPFTCTWLPGKRPLPLAVLAVLAILWVTAAFADIVAITVTNGPRTVVELSAVLLVAAGCLRWRRRRTWAARPLEFEDEDPSRMQQLGLGPS
jgi:hypothetical protein